MKKSYMLLILVFVFSYSCRAPIYIFTTKDGKYGASIIRNDSLEVRVKPITVISNETNFWANGMEWTFSRNDGYVIPVEIEISNYLDDTLSVKITGIRACFQGKKNEIYEGVVNKNVDTIIDAQSTIKLPLVIELNNFYRSSFNKISDLDNHILEIIFSQTSINKSFINNKRAKFIGKMH